MHRAAAILRGRPVIAYNAEFEQRALSQTCEKWGIEPLILDGHCAMLAYSRHRAVPHPWRRGDFKWHKLIDAARHEGAAYKQNHRALGDAQIAYNLVVAIARHRRGWTVGSAARSPPKLEPHEKAELVEIVLAGSTITPPWYLIRRDGTDRGA